MNRSERRRLLRESDTTDKLKKWLMGLTPEQKKLFSLTVGQEVDRINKDTEYVLDSCYATAIDDNLDISVEDIKKIVIDANNYMEEVKEYLSNNRKGYFMKIEDEKIMNEVKADIVKFMNDGVVKSKALTQLKSKYNIPANVANDLWLQVKEEKGINTKNPHTPSKTDKAKEQFLNEIGTDMQDKLKEGKEESKKVKMSDLELKLDSDEIKPNNSTLKIKSIEIEGQYGIYLKGAEGVKIGDKFYKDIKELERCRKNLDTQVESHEKIIKEEMEKLTKKLEELANNKKREIERYAEIEEVFKM